MNQKEENLFWNPSARAGFLPNSPPVSIGHVIADLDWPELDWLLNILPRLGAISDEDFMHCISTAPVLNAKALEGIPFEYSESLLRAYSLIGCHRIHRTCFLDDNSLPSAIAVPTWYLAKNVGRPPALTYATYVLANLEEAPDSFSPAKNIQVANTITGTSDEEWFIAVHIAVETAGGAVVLAINQIQDGIENDDTAKIVSALESIEAAMNFATTQFECVTEKLGSLIFRKVIRPFLHGYEELQFHGLGRNVKFSYVGETGAQSGVIRSVDSILVPQHEKGVQSSIEKFLECAPPSHKAFITEVSRLGSGLAVISESEIVEARGAALNALANFRQSHLDVVLAYLQPKGEFPADHGTGGTAMPGWLQDLIEGTKSAI